MESLHQTYLQSLIFRALHHEPRAISLAELSDWVKRFRLLGDLSESDLTAAVQVLDSSRFIERSGDTRHYRLATTAWLSDACIANLGPRIAAVGGVAAGNTSDGGRDAAKPRQNHRPRPSGTWPETTPWRYPATGGAGPIRAPRDTGIRQGQETLTCYACDAAAE